MAIISTVTISMARRFDASAKQVFAAWTRPELMKKWLFTSEETNKAMNIDFRVGGKWEIIDHRNGTDYRAIGEYLKVVEPNKIVFTFKMPQFNDGEDTIRVTISPVLDDCEMLFTQEIAVPHEEEWTPEEVEGTIAEHRNETEKGWSAMFEGLKQVVENK
ncbi:SRPBCC family protein [Planococcus sp. YIM B11945]|uniref:SRPBCC family protein n=1 Tax=Planococcus sp. YIM B11945 TaxID=3435410 RepID=UPI003D7DA7DB